MGLSIEINAHLSIEERRESILITDESVSAEFLKSDLRKLIAYFKKNRAILLERTSGWKTQERLGHRKKRGNMKLVTGVLATLLIASSVYAADRKSIRECEDGGEAWVQSCEKVSDLSSCSETCRQATNVCEEAQAVYRDAESRHEIMIASRRLRESCKNR